VITLGTLKTIFTNALANEGVSDLIGDWVYLTEIEILNTTHKYWWNKRKDDFDTVDGTGEYFLSSDVWGKDILWMGDEDIQGKEIVETDLETIYSYDSTPTDEGEPFLWALVNSPHVQASNTATTSSAVSSSNSDLSITVTIRGKVSGNHRVETISLNGTTTATPSSALTWDADSVYEVQLSSVCVGVVTVTIGTSVAVIPPGELRVECPRIRLYYVPGDARTIPYIYYRRPRKMTADAQIIEMPDSIIPCFMKGIEYWGHFNNGDLDFARAAKEEFMGLKQEAINLSSQQLKQEKRKYWDNSVGKVPFYLPRTIDATVTE